MALPGCAHRPAPLLVDNPVPVTVVVKDTPPAELTRCAARPDGLPEDKALLAQIPTRIRQAIIRMAKSFAGNASQLDRLINWTAAGTCPATPKEVAP